MPIYEYECPTHGRFEVQQRITEDSLKSCPIEHCGQPVRKLISATSFALKGSGWYATDYGGKTATTDTKSTETKSETKAETKTEAKQETKAETKSEAKAESGTGSASAAQA